MLAKIEETERSNYLEACFMKPIGCVAVLILLNALLICASHTANAEPNKGNGQRGGQGGAHMSAKGGSNTNAQWSADPDRGWVRAEERHELRDERKDASKSKQSGGKPDSTRTMSHSEKKKGNEK